MDKFSRNVYILAILIGLTCIPLFSLLYPGLPLTHDGPDHVARIANFFASLSEGNPVPRWASDLNWGYGHPILMFLYPLSSYIASFFMMMGFSVIDGTKLVFGVTYVLSAAAMYMWVSSVWGKRAGFIGGLLYAFAPYRFVDLYVRGAIGEHVAFVFPPLICYFLYKLATHTSIKSQEPASTQRGEPGTRFDREASFARRARRATTYYIVGASLSIAALILSHNALSIMFLPVIGLYAIYLFFTDAKKSIVFITYCLLSLAFGFGLSSFFWIPAYFEGKYTLRDIVTGGTVVSRFVTWFDFINVSWNYGQSDTLPKSIGIVQILGLASAVFILFRRWISKRERSVLLGSLILLFATLFIQTSGSNYIWKSVQILQKFQFPWRFLSVTVFLTALIGGISISIIINNIKNLVIRNSKLSRNQELRTRNILFTAFCFLSILVTSYMWQPKGYKPEHESFYTGIYPGTTDTGESSPIWSVRFMEHTPPNPLSVVDGEASVKETARTTTVREYDISVTKPTLMMENTLFFPGWKIYIDGIPTGIQFQNPDYRGRMMFRVTEGDHRVLVVFGDTGIRKTANTISVVSFSLLVCVYIGGMAWKRKK